MENCIRRLLFKRQCTALRASSPMGERPIVQLLFYCIPLYAEATRFGRVTASKEATMSSILIFCTSRYEMK